MRGMTNFILHLSDEFPLLIQASLGRLLELMSFWRARIHEDLADFDAPRVKRSHRTEELKKNSFHQTQEATEFRGSVIDSVPVDVTLYSILFDSPDKNKWARCLSELVKYVAVICPSSVQEAKLQVIHITPTEMGGKAHKLLNTDKMLPLWLLIQRSRREEFRVHVSNIYC
ncbi:hypothetical protein LIER_40794 [Lithospermum erythrorhizon]|uniref:Cell morphogenesis central region domain-containing protein n=1 Tax=Lithospermum erythrorhizon TaxID=34254 RepID=A0AAV3R3G8_LITER